ncbi:MAG: RnfABCDGE type electron transport complex subunit C [Bacilli bacterium]|nr:RnfABCDGE type electron transport complex subunit C [Bacilli bacterium]
MIKGIKIKTYKELTKNKDIYKYNKPDMVYIPLACGMDKNVSVLVNKKDYVYKGQVLGNRLGNLKIPIISSVSGIVQDIKEMTYIDNSKVKCVVIKNDFKEEERHTKKDVNKITKEEFINILKEAGIRGQGGADFPTYIKYDNQNINYLIVNAIECEPFITCDYMVLKTKPKEILEAIDAIMEINKIKKCYIAIKKNNREIINIYNEYIGMYPKIVFYETKNIYPMGWERNLIKEILKEDYDRLPIEKNIVVNNLQTIYAIYQALFQDKKYTKRVFTITGLENSININVEAKIGTRIIDIIEELGTINKDYNIIANGPMMGKIVDIEDLVLSSNLNCLLVLPKKEYEETKCLRCAKCTENCPANLSPILIKENIKDKETLKKLTPNKCIECGLCSYICPAKINLRDYVIKAKEVK